MSTKPLHLDMHEQIACAQTLASRFYTDPTILEIEKARIFQRTWQLVGTLHQSCGEANGVKRTISDAESFFTMDVVGEPVIVVRDKRGELRAFSNVCRHRAGPIALGSGCKNVLRCQYHGWTYALDGRLLGATHMQDSGFCREDYPLNRVHADLWDGHLFLNLSAHPEPLMSQLAYLPGKFAAWRMQDLRLQKRIVYDVKANWKLIVLNYNECLHCPVLHPCLNRLTDYLGADNDAPQSTYLGGSMGFRNGAQTMSLDGQRRRDYLPGLHEEQRTQVYYYAIYPNLLLSLHPDYMMVHTLWPKAPDRTEVVCEWHFHPAEMAKSHFQCDDAIDFWDLTNREDWGISELSQKGISSRAYKPGPYSPRERLLHAFDEMVLAREAESKRNHR